MKIYFDGDSWTWGCNLDDESRLSLRFSALVSKELGAEEHNISKSGKSNHSIVRHLLLENDISQYDFAIIQMSFPNRMEYYNEEEIREHKKWTPISMGSLKNSEFWKQYYKEIYNDTYGSTYEQIFAMTIRNHCKVNNVKCILLSNNFQTNVKFDLQLQHRKYPQNNNFHPNEEGHRLIADDLLTYINQ